MHRRLWIHLGPDIQPPADVQIDGLVQAWSTIRASSGSGKFAHNLLAPLALDVPIFHHRIGHTTFASNCTAAYLLAQVDEATLFLPEREEALPRFVGTLAEIQVALVEHTIKKTSRDILVQLDVGSRKGREERHRRLALLRGHLTAMRRKVGSAEQLIDLEARISALFTRESRVWT